MSARVGSVQQIPEQRGGAGSSPSEAADWTDARIQTIRHGVNYDQRYRVGGKDQESAVSNRKAAYKLRDSARSLGCTTRLITGY